MAKVAVILNLVASKPNAPPQYTGPTTINDLVIGVGRQLQGFDPDGDQITWSVDPEFEGLVEVTPGGVLTAKSSLGVGGTPQAVTIYLDDGKPSIPGGSV